MADAASELSSSELLLVSDKIGARRQVLNRSKLQPPGSSSFPEAVRLDWSDDLAVQFGNRFYYFIPISVCEIRQKFAYHVSLDSGINRWESLVPSCPISGSILHTQSPNLYFGSKAVTKN